MIFFNTHFFKKNSRKSLNAFLQQDYNSSEELTKLKLKIEIWEVVVTQLAEQLLLNLEVRCSNHVIDEFLTNIHLLSRVLQRQNKKEAGHGPFFIKCRERDNIKRY